MNSLFRISVVCSMIGGMIPSSFAQHEVLDSLGYRLAFHWNGFPHKTWYYNDAWGWTAPDGREYAIIGTLDSTYFFDVTNPDSVVLVDVEAGRDSNCIHRDYKTYGHYCYAVADEGNSSLQIFDLSYLPDSVHKVYDDDTFCIRAHNLFIDTFNGVLYLASNTYPGPNGQYRFSGVSLLSLADPANPTLIGHYEPSVFQGGRAHDVFVYDDTAFLSLEGLGLGVYTFAAGAAPAQVSFISQYPGKGYNHSSWASPRRRLVVFADETHGAPLKIYDYSNPAAPILKSIFGEAYTNGSIPHNPFIVDDTLVWISYYHEGVVVFDISDPTAPRKVFHYDTYPNNDSLPDGMKYMGYEGCWGVYPFFPSGKVIALDITHGLFVFAPEVDSTASSVASSIIRRLRVYPNPADSYLHIEIPDGMALREGEIYDGRGRRVGRWKVNGMRRARIAVDRLPPGAYYLRLGPYAAPFRVVR